jgi:hypothetical protein
MLQFNTVIYLVLDTFLPLHLLENIGFTNNTKREYKQYRIALCMLKMQGINYKSKKQLKKI